MLHIYTDYTVHMKIQTMIEWWLGARKYKRRCEVALSNQIRSVTEILKPANKSKDDEGRDHGDIELRICSKGCR